MPVSASCLAASGAVGMTVSPALAHGTSAGDSVGAFAPLILLGGVAVFVLFYFFVDR